MFMKNLVKKCLGKKLLGQVLFLAKLGLTGGGDVKFFRKFVSQKKLSKTVLFQKVLSGEAKQSGRVYPREEINPSPQKIVGLKNFCII